MDKNGNKKEVQPKENKQRINIATCPVSNLKLGCGIAKINKMLAEDLNISIGTDGQGSGSNLDLFESMKYVALLQKGIDADLTIINTNTKQTITKESLISKQKNSPFLGREFSSVVDACIIKGCFRVKLGTLLT